MTQWRTQSGVHVLAERPCSSSTGRAATASPNTSPNMLQGAFKLLIADEVHQFKSKSSDRGVAFHQLVTAANGR